MIILLLILGVLIIWFKINSNFHIRWHILYIINITVYYIYRIISWFVFIISLSFLIKFQQIAINILICFLIRCLIKNIKFVNLLFYILKALGFIMINFWKWLITWIIVIIIIIIILLLPIWMLFKWFTI